MLTQITQLQGWRPLQPSFCLVVLTTSLVPAGNVEIPADRLVPVFHNSGINQEVQILTQNL